jgi:arsenate reductase
MKKEKVLFVCVHNSARSQMAEAFLNQVCGEHFEAQSAGLEPGKLNPFVIEVMREIGFDLSSNRTKAVSTLLGAGQRFDWVITVCDESSAERCPVFPGPARRLHWGFPDPSGFQGTREEKLVRTREVREAIKEKIRRWCSEVCPQAVA